LGVVDRSWKSLSSRKRSVTGGERPPSCGPARCACPPVTALVALLVPAGGIL